MTHTIYSCHVSSTEMRPLIAGCHFSEEALVLLECIPERIITKQRERQDLLRFDFLDKFLKQSSDSLKLEDYTSGRVFQLEGELRWEKAHNGFRVVYVGNEGKFSRDVVEILPHHSKKVSSPDLPPLRSHQRKYYLFGTRLAQEDIDAIGPLAQPGDFAEARIHRLLRYPRLKEDYDGPLHFIIEELLDINTGQRVLFRFVGLDGEKKDKETA